VPEVSRAPRLGGIWVVPPPGCGENTEPERFADAARRAGVVVVRALCTHHGYRLGGEELDPLWAALAARSMALTVAAADADPAEIGAIAARHPELTVLVGDLGYRSMRAMSTLFDRPNVRFLTDNLSGHQALEWLVATIGVDRVLFATGGPTRDGAEAVTRLLLSSLNEVQIQRVGAGNLEDVIARAA
jgi:predicted TIM-barrel fold metal-dependent hydrolase